MVHWESVTGGFARHAGAAIRNCSGLNFASPVAFYYHVPGVAAGFSLILVMNLLRSVLQDAP